MKVWEPVPDGVYKHLIGRESCIEEGGKRFSIDVPEYDCNTGEWYDTPCYTDMQDIRLCRLVEAPPVPPITDEVRADSLDLIESLLAGEREEFEYYAKKEAWADSPNEKMRHAFQDATRRIARIDAALAWLDSLKGEQ